MRILCHIVTWNSADQISRSLPYLQGVKTRVTDNASTDNTAELVSQFSDVELIRNSENLGFSAAHNQGIQWALKEGADAVLILNPDAFPTPGAIQKLAETLKENPKIGAITPKILRCDGALQPLTPPIIDAAGMYITTEFRHFDRGSGETDTGQYDTPEFVFGGTGAALLLTRECLHDLAKEVFDEDFFAYREDADLSFRLQTMGWPVFYQPEALFYHVRRVVPENRRALPAKLNALSVRNRFLLQWKNLSLQGHFRALPRTLFRNMVVISGVILQERSSLPALLEALALLPKMLRKRAVIPRRVSPGTAGRWLRQTTER